MALRHITGRSNDPGGSLLRLHRTLEARVGLEQALQPDGQGGGDGTGHRGSHQGWVERNTKAVRSGCCLQWFSSAPIDMVIDDPASGECGRGKRQPSRSRGHHRAHHNRCHREHQAAHRRLELDVVEFTHARARLWRWCLQRQTLAAGGTLYQFGRFRGRLRPLKTLPECRIGLGELTNPTHHAQPLAQRLGIERQTMTLRCIGERAGDLGDILPGVQRLLQAKLDLEHPLQLGGQGGGGGIGHR